MIARVTRVTNVFPVRHARATNRPRPRSRCIAPGRAAPRRAARMPRHASHHTRNHDARMMREKNARAMIARVMRVTNGNPAPHVRATNRPRARRIPPRRAAPRRTTARTPRHATPRIMCAIMTRSRRAGELRSGFWRRTRRPTRQGPYIHCLDPLGLLRQLSHSYVQIMTYTSLLMSMSRRRIDQNIKISLRCRSD